MNNLEKKLQESAVEAQKDGEAILSEVKLLLASDAQDERNTLLSIGLDSDLRLAMDKNADHITRRNGKATLGKSIVHHDEIRKLCLDYRLYLRPAREYVGAIPADLGAELTRFCKESNVVLPAHSSYSKFFIIAPPKMFNDYMSPVEVFVDAMDKHHERVEEARRRRLEDPILVYQLPDNPGYYAIIKSWGDDFTPLRRVYGELTKGANLRWITALINLLFVALMVQLAVWDWKYFILQIIFTCIWIFNDDLQKFRKDILKTICRYEVKKYKA